MLPGHKPNPGRQATSGPERFQSPTSATNAVATIGPMPGISSSRWLSSHDRCQPWICFSMTLISAVIFAYWRARASRLNRAATGMRSSRALARTSSSPAVPLRPFAEMMPSSAYARGSHSTASFANGLEPARRHKCSFRCTRERLPVFADRASQALCAKPGAENNIEVRAASIIRYILCSHLATS
jgi:hypothetical protein